MSFSDGRIQVEDEHLLVARPPMDCIEAHVVCHQRGELRWARE